MAEEVKIVDVAGGPAAEATLQEILKVLKGQGGAGGGGAGGAKAAAKAQELYTTAVTRGTTTQSRNTKEVKNTTSALKTFSSGLTTILGGAFGALGTVLGGATGIIKNFGDAVMNASSITEFVEAIPVFGSLLSKATGYFDTSLETFRKLSESGASFGNDMLAMRSAAAQSGLRLEQFAEMVGNNASRMTLLGSTVSEGAARFGKITRQLRQSDAGLMRLGFTQEEVNEGFGDYIEMMARSGQLQGRSNAQLAAGAQSYLTEIDKLARVTGKSRKELQDEMNQRMAAANYNVLAARLSGQALLNFQNNTEHTASMMGQGFADVMTDLGDGVAQSGFAQRLQSAVPGLADLAEANARGELSQEEYQARMAALMPQITAFADRMGAAGTSALMQEEGFAEFMESVANARTYTQRMADGQKAAEEQARRAPLTETFASFGQTIQDIRSDVEEALLDSGVMDALGTAVGGVSTVLTDVVSGITGHIVKYLKSDEFKQDVETFKEKIQSMAQKARNFVSYLRSDEFKTKVDNFIQGLEDAWASISGFITDVQETSFSEAVAKMFGGEEGQGVWDLISEKIGSGLKSIWENHWMEITGAIAALFLGPKILSAMTSGIGSMFGGLFKSSAPAGGGGAPGVRGPSGAARAGQGVGDFVGNVGGGVLSGIAKGLAAFANPQTAIGGAVLAGVILVIGAAVAGATWLVGKSLPTFAEGMSAFEELDGAKLKSAGAGMLAVAGGMAAFGAGSAVAGLGNLVGNIADGIGALFGAEKANPLEQLLEFQKYNIDEAKVTGNANALVAYSKAMAAFGAADAASGLGSLVSGLADGITSFFGGETGIPYDQVTTFASYTFDEQKIKANAAAMVAFNNALTASSAAQATSGVSSAIGAIGSAISSFFGGETPFDKVKNFGEMDINAEGVSSNAQAMVSMANALNAFTGGESSDIEISNKTVASLRALSELGATTGLSGLATNLQAVANVTGLKANIDALNSLDNSSVVAYNNTMRELVDVMKELNDELAKDNKVGFGTGTNAGDVVAKMDTIGGGSGSGSSEQLDRLNMLVGQLIALNTDIKSNTGRTVNAINGNLQAGIG